MSKQIYRIVELFTNNLTFIFVKIQTLTYLRKFNMINLGLRIK
jgi:hypothetical protein